MCGIAGFLGQKDQHDLILPDRVIRSIGHRGPDGYGFDTIYSNSGMAFFAHSRLAIIDITNTGSQPMSIKDKSGKNNITIIFNGEIYNYGELREELKCLGFRFSGNSDTEVILCAYLAWSTDSFRRLVGMFAFALADAGKDKVFFVRDHLGIKPFYYFENKEGGLSFASETRSFRVLPGGENASKINRNSLHGFLSLGMVLGNKSFVQGVEELEPGHCIISDFAGKIRDKIFFLNSACMDHMRFSDRSRAISAIRKSLALSVDRHLVADVPVGIFLSAGIDSASLTALASESHPDLRTISIGFDQREADESGEASLIASQLGVSNEVVTLTGADILAGLEMVFQAMDQPTVDGFNTFFVSKAARAAGLKVALSGLGGDELFGGYASFHDVPMAKRLAGLIGFGGVGNLMAMAGKVFGSRSLWKAGRTGSYRPGFASLYFLRRELFSPVDRLDLLEMPSPEVEPITGAPFELLENLERNISGLDPENTVAILEQQVYMRNMLLRDSDVFSMANGLEIRVPFLDQDLLALVNPMPGSWKNLGSKPKALLIDAVGKRFPSRILGKKKRGFTFPWEAWFRGPMAGFAKDRLFCSTWDNLGIPLEKVEKIWSRFIAKDPTVTALHVLALVSLADLVERQGLGL
jgi:asparagine synthase (glutamine-hydrolysing)